MDNPNIINVIKRSMEQAEQAVDYSGGMKKAFALKLIRENIGDVLFERYQFVINETIDFICQISRNGLNTTINSYKTKAKTFFCCR